MRLSDAHALNTTPSLTVVIPCYNYGRFLESVVASVFDSSGVETDAIIVDDCSTDDSVSIAERIVERDPRVRLVRNPTNLGHIASYNSGLSLVTADYAVLLSADDLLAPGSLTRACAVMEANPSIGLAYGAVEVFSDSPPQSAASHSRLSWAIWDGHGWAEEVFRFGRNPLVCPEAVLRRSSMDRAGLYDPDHPHAGDLQMWLRIAAVSDVGFVSGATQAYYRQHGQNMHSQVFEADQAAGMVTDLRERQRAFASQSGAFPGGRSMLENCNKALAREAVDLASRAYVWGFADTWPVEGLISFARQCDPQVERTSSWRAYRRRAWVGRDWARKNPLFVPREYTLRYVQRNAGRRASVIGVGR